MDPYEDRAQEIQVLLVEDSPGDVRLTQQALKDANLHINLQVARDGIEAMSFLKQEGEYAKSPRPDLILLDYYLPGMRGDELCRRIRMNIDTRGIPILMLTTEASDEVEVRGLESGASVVWVPAWLRYLFGILRLAPRSLWRRLPG